MADNARQTEGPYGPVRVRPEELIRPAETRRYFPIREAQRHLQSKERPRWALMAYVVFLAAALAIFGITYTTFAFSKYRGVILPGVHVDQTSLEGLTQTQAENLIERQLSDIFNNPVRLVGGPWRWDPSGDSIGVKYRVQATVQKAVQVGREEPFPIQLIDRLPLHPEHSVPLLYQADPKTLQAYIRRQIVPRLNSSPMNASLSVSKDNRVVLNPSRPGQLVDVPATQQEVESALGHLTKQIKTVPLRRFQPVITDAVARRYQSRVEDFLSHPPLVSAGKWVIRTSRLNFAPALSFRDVTGKRPAILMQVNSDAIQGLVSWLASQIDRQPANARLEFSAGQVQVVSRMKIGRTLDQADALRKLVAVVWALKPNARLHFVVRTVQPPIDETNPASLGITNLLGVGNTSFIGSDKTRLDDVETLAKRLDNVELKPKDEISFNYLVGSGWPDSFYQDQETEQDGQLVPGTGGAMQQVATAFLRALYWSGLTLVERHSHVHRFGWYEPPIGFDAVVSPGGDDLVFKNNTGGYLLLQTRVEPLQQELYIYVYGRNTRWRVRIGKGKVVKVLPHPPDIIRQDPSLAPGDIRPVAFAHDGAQTVIRRTIIYANGKKKRDEITSDYQPWRAILVVGTLPTPTPRPKATGTPGAGSAQSKTPVALTPTPGPSPTPTFSH